MSSRSSCRIAVRVRDLSYDAPTMPEAERVYRFLCAVFPGEPVVINKEVHFL